MVFSPAAYALSAVFLGLSGWVFVYLVSENLYTPRTVPSLYALSTAFWLPLLIAGITMRVFAEERQSGTLETLLTAPVSDAQVVLGKFLAAFGFILLQLLLSTLPVFWLARVARLLTTLDGAGMTGALVILAAMALSGTAIGVLVSLSTRHQSVAAALTLALLLLPYLLFLAAAQAFPGWRRYLGGYPVEETILRFARGTIDPRWLVLHCSIALMALFACVRLLEARLWRR